MKNFIKKGEILDYVAGANILSGDLVIAGSLAGVAVTDIANGATGSVNLKGVYKIAKATGVAFTQGVKLYWVTADKNLTTTVGSNTLVGVANKAALTGDTTAELLLTNGI